jgi:hypothetical protein
LVSQEDEPSRTDSDEPSTWIALPQRIRRRKTAEILSATFSHEEKLQPKPRPERGQVKIFLAPKTKRQQLPDGPRSVQQQLPRQSCDGPRSVQQQKKQSMDLCQTSLPNTDLMRDCKRLGKKSTSNQRKVWVVAKIRSQEKSARKLPGDENEPNPKNGLCIPCYEYHLY